MATDLWRHNQETDLPVLGPMAVGLRRVSETTNFLYVATVDSLWNPEVPATRRANSMLEAVDNLAMDL
jgi:hypothetical protein